MNTGINILLGIAEYDGAYIESLCDILEDIGLEYPSLSKYDFESWEKNYTNMIIYKLMYEIANYTVEKINNILKQYNIDSTVEFEIYVNCLDSHYQFNYDNVGFDDDIIKYLDNDVELFDYLKDYHNDFMDIYNSLRENE